MLKTAIVSTIFLLGFIVKTQAQIIYINNAGKEQQFDSTFFQSEQVAHITLKAISVENVKLLPGLF